MITKEELTNRLRHCDETDLEENMVGAAILINPDGTQHAAIFLRYNSESKLFHFTGKSVIIEDVSGMEDYYLKSLDFLPAILLPAFMAQSELILEKAQPEFGYFYEGSLYDTNGDFVSPGASPQYMTCVGFCLNVIKGFLSDQDFFQYEDWDEKSLIGKMEHVESFLSRVNESYPDIKLEDFKVNLRRILPIEYVAGAFSRDLPVRKAFTDSIVEDLQKSLDEKKVA
ncbi:hypothetical protein [Pedobacter faecalis]|uniref:hypothetical protein n=1 Tax=Pedobacter faecalis TaxID=3041495 RepID=UPI0025518ADE|nr:hypothetical protein [Pedobacter sp. ELA7]